MSNCLIFVVMLWWRGRDRRARRRKRENFRSYFAMRKSDSGFFPHFLWIERHHTISYKPVSPIDRKCPPALFEGRVRWGDPAPPNS